ncbi:MAG: vWA domain-containing protein, partial [Planctomycetota bacterium]
MQTRTWRFVGRTFIPLLGAVFAFQVGPHPAQAGSSWLSKTRQVPRTDGTPAPAPHTEGMPGPAPRADSSTTVFDIVISLYNDPSGDDDPDNDTGTEDQTNYEEIIRFWADSICEQSNGALELGKVRIFRNGIHGSLADVVWNASEWPRAAPSGFGVSGSHITFGDVFPDGRRLADGSIVDVNHLDPAEHELAGYTLGHEFGHYVLGLYDEYEGTTSGAGKPIYWPRLGDIEPDSIMNAQWRAVGGDFEWLNHSTEDNYEAKTGQGRVYGASCWEVMIREVSEDPKDGDRSTLAQRVRYSALVGEEPTAADGWVIENLPGAQADCRSELEIIWMQDDIEMQIVIDRSGSMLGDPFANAQEAAKTLVDEVENGKTALGVVSFNESAGQDQPIVAIPDPPGTV